MLKQDFEINYQSLCDNYSKPFHQKQVDEWFKSIHNFDLPVIEQSLDRIKRDRDTFPSLSVILRYCRDLMQHRHVKNWTGEPCKYCDEGLIHIHEDYIVKHPDNTTTMIPGHTQQPVVYRCPACESSLLNGIPLYRGNINAFMGGDKRA